MIWLTRQCFNCSHWAKGSDPIVCAAFPGGIPAAILSSKADHTQPFDGDHGLRFEPMKEGAESGTGPVG
jgi:hypothetical protein